MSISLLYEQYCSQKVLAKLNSFNDLNDLIDTFLHDDCISEYINSFDVVKSCSDLLSEHDHTNNNQVLQKFLSLRILYYIVGSVWAQTILHKVPANQIIGNINEKVKLPVNSKVIVESFELDQLLQAIFMSASLKLNMKLKCAEGKFNSALDLNVDQLSLELLNKSRIDKFIVLVNRPHQEHTNSLCSNIRQNFDNVIFKRGILFSHSNSKIYFDETGNMLLNSKPHGQSIHDCYPSITLSDAIIKHKSELTKLKLDDLTFKQLLLSDTNKALKKYTKELVILANEPLNKQFTLFNFSEDEIVKPCYALYKLLDNMSHKINKFKPLLQFDSYRPDDLVLIFKS